MLKNKLFALLFVFILAGCAGTSMKFEPTVDLRGKYDQTSKDRHLAIHYSVKSSPAGGYLMMAVQNVGNIYMKNLIINYDECCQPESKGGSGAYTYQNLGNLKNRSHKTMTLKLPEGDLKTVKLAYTFTPVQEDSFLYTKDTAGAVPPAETPAVAGQLILYIGK